MIDTRYYKPHTNTRQRVSLRWLFLIFVGSLLIALLMAFTFAGEEARAQSLDNTLGGATKTLGGSKESGSSGGGGSGGSRDGGGSKGGLTNSASESAAKPAPAPRRDAGSAGRTVETGGQPVGLGEPERRLTGPTTQQTRQRVGSAAGVVGRAAERTFVPVQRQARQAAEPVGQAASHGGQTTEPLAGPIKKAAEPARETLRPVVDQAAQTVEPGVEPVRRTIEPVREAVGPVTEPIRRTVEPAVKPIQKVVEPVRETAKPAIGPVRRTVEPLVKPVSEAAKPATKVIQQTVEPVADPANVAANPAISPTPASVSVEDVARRDGSPYPQTANSLASRSKVSSLSTKEAEGGSPNPGLVSASRGNLEGPGLLLAVEEEEVSVLHELLAPHPRLLGHYLFGESPTILSRDATTGGTSGLVPLPFSSFAAPASGGALGGSGPGFSAGLAILALVSILLFRSKFSWSFLEFLRPNSALRLAIERPG